MARGVVKLIYSVTRNISTAPPGMDLGLYRSQTWALSCGELLSLHRQCQRQYSYMLET